jgi:hypothetical protein
MKEVFFIAVFTLVLVTACNMEDWDYEKEGIEPVMMRVWCGDCLIHQPKATGELE